MGAVTRTYDDKIKRAIRDAVAVGPLLTLSALVEHLDDKFAHSFDPRYIKRLSNKVMGEMRTDLDRAKIEQRIKALKETHRIAREALLRIILWQPNPDGPPLQKSPSAQA
jgi:hypothetical protein